MSDPRASVRCDDRVHQPEPRRRHELMILNRSVAILRPDERALTRDQASRCSRP